MAGSGLLRPITPASQAVARTNQRISQFCSVIEAEDKESAKFETYHFFFFPREKREAVTFVLVPPKGSVLDLVVKNLT